MLRTVLGIFNSVNEANRAVERLLNSGFDRGLIDVAINDRHHDEGQSGIKGHGFPDGQVSERLHAFFSSLFDDQFESSGYAAVAAKSAAIVTVQTNTENEAVRASAILDECGAVDAGEQARSIDHEALGGPTSLERDPFSASDEVASRLADDDLSDETRTPVPQERDADPEGNSTRPSVRSRIIERPVDEGARLREERVIVQKPGAHKDSIASR